MRSEFAASAVPEAAVKSERASLAETILSQRDDPVAAKLGDVFKPELEACRDNQGRLDPFLFSAFALTSMSWHADTRAVEGINSRIKLLSKRYRRLGLPGLCADLVVMNACELGTREAPTKWSQMSPIVDRVVPLVLATWDRKKVDRIMMGYPALCDDSKAPAPPVASRVPRKHFLGGK